MSSKKSSRFAFPLSLRTILIFPYVIFLIFTITTAVFISSMYGHNAVNNVAHQLQNETTSRVQHYLESFLSLPHKINELNAYAIQNGNLIPDDASSMQQYFLQQVKLQPQVTSIYFGNSEGGLIGAGREGSEGVFYFTETTGLENGDFQKFGLEEDGSIIPLPLAIVPNFDARTRPWYISASQQKKATWSNIYTLFTGQDLAIAASRPVYSDTNELIGVVSVDIFLSQLSRYLEELSLSPSGRIFIMERSGELVATSTGEPLFYDLDQDGAKERLHANESQSTAIRQSNKILLETYGDYKELPDEEIFLEFMMDGEKQFLQFLTVSDDYGIDWIVVVIIPESAFMGQIDAGNQVNMWLIAVTLLVAIGLIILITSRIIHHTTQLDRSAQALAAGEWDLALDTRTNIVELNQLAISFNKMKEQLRFTLHSLTNEVSERKHAEEALRESETRFRAISESAGDLIYMITTNGVIQFVNERAAQALNLTSQELIGKKISEFFPSATHKETWQVFLEVIHDKKPIYTESMAQFPTGDVWLGTWLTPLTDKEGHVVTILGESRNITQRKKMEQEIQAEHVFSTQVINLMGQGLTVTNAEGQFEFVNPAYARLFGYTVEDLIGKSPRDLTAQEDHEVLTEQRMLREAGKTSTYESRLMRADGSIAHVLVNGVPRGQDGQYEGAISVITDLSGQKENELELLSAKNELEAVNQKLEKALARERRLARTDELTGVNNRRYLFDLAERKFAVATRYKQPLSVIMFDIDHFKMINDKWGHIIGDQILTEVAQAVLVELRKADLFGRYGGEEFIIILPMTTSEQAYILAERIRAKVSNQRVQTDKGEISVTISIGIVELHHGEARESLESLFNRADETMYAAKQAGRNRTVILD